ncbi:5-bromo-4-chloroindolyl phosphate hydrolysis family protein [Cytobacillus kochii]|uniref:5-bromo-4-chloroindolyl phosphate hydrolysis family protein n=1 Tax=Cytobacillus TaxID=2675230 RepID=UPI001CD6698A|nr:5-bromo-4-chloroindolyl phosphate hydrolysis family protein [Cytobacillus kochii]MCA1024699.1 5-bromo-4-chloroindolyl phosphate hydrolysis family protein [Cytobacillus kochii]
MNPFYVFFLRILITVPVSVLTWLISYFFMNYGFWMSGLIGAGVGVFTYWLSGIIIVHRWLKSKGLKRKEFRFIQDNLDDARIKMSRLHRALMAIRHWPSGRQRKDFIKVTKRIYQLVQKEPRRFYQAESFFYSHLDSAVELAERYVFLSSQPKKDWELEQSLTETRKTLQELMVHVDKDLRSVLANDIDDLHYEIDVAKHNIKKLKDEKTNDESRRLK